ncbi:MAG: site-specific DNA-methyltransferase, partial [Spirochaetales bacterium]
MEKEALPRLDTAPGIREALLPCCRLKKGEIWEDPVKGHRVGVLDAAVLTDVERIMGGEKAACIINDPPYNLKVGGKSSRQLSRRALDTYMDFSRAWVINAAAVLAENSHLYVWLGADQNDGFQPLPDFMIMMRGFPDLQARSFITVRNQRGYGTQKNWMAVRQELLYYVKGSPPFTAVYTDIPKVLKGYYKSVGGVLTENIERSRSPNIRPGNVWLDIQQVFYRMEENVPGAYAQKPLKALERILLASSAPAELVADFFAHAGTTLLACEKLGRRCVTFDLDPLYAELSIRRLEHF